LTNNSTILSHRILVTNHLDPTVVRRTKSELSFLTLPPRTVVDIHRRTARRILCHEATFFSQLVVPATFDRPPTMPPCRSASILKA